MQYQILRVKQSILVQFNAFYLMWNTNLNSNTGNINNNIVQRKSVLQPAIQVCKL